jgi:hypothetical protein
MQIGNHLEIPGIRGADDLICDLPDTETGRKVKAYLVPDAVSADRYYISIIPTGTRETVPPFRTRDTLLLIDFVQDNEGNININFIHEEIQNA